MKTKTTRRLLSLLLALALALSLVPVTAGADGEAITSYPLWVGNVQVTSENCSNIPLGVGNGTASYDPATHTLTLHNATITQGYTSVPANGLSAIHVPYGGLDTLTINLIGNNTVGGDQVTSGLSAQFCHLVFQGGGSLTATGGKYFESAFCTGILGNSITVNGGTILGTAQHRSGTGILASNITVTGGSLSGIAEGSYGFGVDADWAISVTGGNLSGTGACGVYAFGKINLAGGTLRGTRITDKDTDNPYAVHTYAENGITPGKYMQFPDNITLIDGGRTLTSKESNTEITVIPVYATYPLWVGSAQVTGENCGNILGDNTASYDPDTRTLTLDNATITGSHEDAAIYYDGTDDLHIQGTGTVGNETIRLGLLARNGPAITLDAGEGTLSFTGKVIGFRGYNSSVTILGGEVTATGNGYEADRTYIGAGFDASNLTVTGGKLTATSIGDYGGRGILVYNSFTIQAGTVEATGAKFGISVGNSPSESYEPSYGTLSIQGGTVHAKGGTAAIYVGKELTKTNSTEIVTPTNGTIGKARPQGYSEFTTVLSGNEAAKEVDIRPLVRNIALAVDPAGGGEAKGGGEYDHGHTATVTAKANEGYKFVYWLEDDTQVSTNASYSFTVEKDRTLTAVFQATVPTPPQVEEFNIIVDERADQMGYGEAFGGGIYDKGHTATVTATPNPGYTFVRWTEDGKEVSRSANYTFTVEKDRTLLAEFAVASSGGGGGSKPAAPAVTIPVTGEGSVQIKVTVTGDAAAVSPLTEAQIKAVTSSDDPTVDVVLDLTALGGEIANVSLPTDTLAKLADALSAREGQDTVTVKTAAGEVSFDETALAALVQDAPGEAVVLHFAFTPKEDLSPAQQAALADKEVMGALDLSVMIGGEAVTAFGGGSVKITVPLTPPQGKEGRFYQVYYVGQDGSLEPRPTSFLNNLLSFLTPHFSNYVLVYEARTQLFPDVPADAWYHDAVYWAVAQGVTQGTSQTAFSPLAPCTRAQMVTFLWRAAGEPKAASAENPFTDVKDGAYYLDAVLWAVEKGITQGTGKTTFSPDAKVTRAQTVTFLYRYEQSQGGGFTGAWAFPLDYSDAADVAQWAYEPFCWMTTHGVVAGSGGKLLPNANCSRAEIVTMLTRYFAPA